MWQALIRRLGRAYPLDLTLGAVLRRAFAFGLFVWLFLWLFGPFGLSGVPAPQRLVETLGYGAVTCGGLLVLTWGLQRLLPSSFDETRWTLGRQVAYSALIMLSVGVFNWVYSLGLGYAAPTLTSAVRMVGLTVLTGLLPWTLLLLLNEQRLTAQHRAEADEVNAKLDLQAEAKPEEIIVLRGTLTDERLSLAPGALLALVAADNYVELHHELPTGGLQRTLLRQTLSALADQLAHRSEFMRVHRGYVANLSRVTALSGNAQGYRLVLPPLTLEVPVARAYTAALRARLAELGHPAA